MKCQPFLLLLCCSCFAPLPAGADLATCIEATCRVRTPDGSTGSGCVFERSQDRLWILTCQHVVEGYDRVHVEFWHRGHQSERLPGAVVMRSRAADAAIVSVDVRHFGAGPVPPAIPLADPADAPTVGTTVCSVGCAQGAWATAWKGHALGYLGRDLYCRPPPHNGRSGSAVFDAGGTRIVGIIQRRNDRMAAAAVLPVAVLHETFGGERQTQSSQCGPLGCSPGNGGWFGRPVEPGTPRAAPQREQLRPPSPFKTLPQSDRTYERPPLDLSQTNRRLDRIADLLREMKADRREDDLQATPSEIRRRQPQQPLDGAAPPPWQPAIDKADQALAVARRVEDEVGLAWEAKEETGRLAGALEAMHETVGALAGDIETLPERFNARLEKVKAEGAEGTLHVARAYVHDYVREKLSDGTLGWTAGRIAGGALGLSAPLAVAIAAGAWIVSRRVGGRLSDDDPRLVERLGQRVYARVAELLDWDDAEAERPKTARRKRSAK